MPTPLPWSPSSLESFMNCAWSFHEQKVAKTRQPYPSAASDWGNRVHSMIEDFLTRKTKKLPPELSDHEEYVLKAMFKRDFGDCFVERKVAFDKKAQALVGWDYPVDQLWARFKIDFYLIAKDTERRTAYCWDWKTGKPHGKLDQLAAYALWLFAKYPDVELVDAKYYWLRNTNHTRVIYAREEIPNIWKVLLPKLQLYAHAFKEDVWPKKQGPLCAFCPVEDCEYWRDGRAWR